jgi:FK506-binding protein 4/5
MRMASLAVAALLAASCGGRQEPGPTPPPTPPAAGAATRPADAPAAEAPAKIPADGAENGSTPTGLRWSILRAGPPGPGAKRGDRVRVHYTGWLPDGTVFDTSRRARDAAPAEFLVGKLVEGWNEALGFMTPGARWKLTVPPSLGYGESGAPPRIPPGATLIFDMELISVSRAPAFRAPDPKARKATESGLKYEVLKATEGARPAEGDALEMEFAAWSAAGDYMDSTVSCEKTLTGPRDRLPLPFLKEAAGLMRVGEEFLFEVPPALGFGARPWHTPWGDIPPESTTVWWIRLARVGHPGEPPPFERPAPEKVRRTASGLGIATLVEGKGDGPKPWDSVTVHYAGWLEDGTPFDSSWSRGLPMTFRLDEVIPGWTEGLQAMRPGGVSVLIVPPGLGYGKRPQGRIPPDSTLVFRVELLEIR